LYLAGLEIVVCLIYTINISSRIFGMQKLTTFENKKAYKSYIFNCLTTVCELDFFIIRKITDSLWLAHFAIRVSGFALVGAAILIVSEFVEFIKFQDTV